MGAMLFRIRRTRAFAPMGRSYAAVAVFGPPLRRCGAGSRQRNAASGTSSSSDNARWSENAAASAWVPEHFSPSPIRM